MLLLFLLLFPFSTPTTVIPTCSGSDGNWQLDDGSLLYYNGECCDENCGNLLDFEKSKKGTFAAQVAAMDPEICEMLKESFQKTTTTSTTSSPLDCGWLAEPATLTLIDGTEYEYSGECCVPEVMASPLYEAGAKEKEKRQEYLQMWMDRGLCDSGKHFFVLFGKKLMAT